MTKTTGNYTDFVTFSRASGGTALRRISYGSELVTNGTFDTDTTGWTASAGGSLSVVGGALRVTEALVDGATGRGYQVIPTVVGKLYLLSVDLVATSNAFDVAVNINANFGGALVADRGSNTPRTIRLPFVATATSTYIIFGVGVDTLGSYSDYDNISVKEVLFDQPDGTLQLFNHPTNVPRVEYDASGNLKGLLIEEARTNLLVQSEDFGTDAGWAWTRSTVTENALAAPNGTTSADYLEQASGQTGAGSVGRTLTISGSGYYTWGVFAKAAEKTFLRVQLTGSNFAHFNLTTGVVGTVVGCTTSMTDFGNGWYRCSVTASLSANPFSLFYVGDADNSLSVTDSGGIYLWGAMFEAGAFPTSYIPTTGATATRAADICSMATSAFGYNQGAGTIVVDVADAQFAPSGYPRVLEIGNSSNSGERINVYVTGVASVYGSSMYTSAAPQGDVPFATSITSPFSPSKAALAYKTNNSAWAYGGTITGTDTIVNVTGTTYPRNTLKIGGNTTSVNDQINGHIKSIRYFPRRLTNAQIQALTA